jgi:nitrile hydratase
MNSIHDMGGMAGFGPINREEDEPVFHDEWERKSFAIHVAAGGVVGPVDRGRHANERIDPALYISMSYYEKWLLSTEMLLKEFGYLKEEEIVNARADFIPELNQPVPNAEQVAAFSKSGRSSIREDCDRKPLFKIGDQVRVRNMNPQGHTRAPRYVRGHIGTINSYHDCHVFPDTRAHDKGDNPQPLYNVSFNARELWGSEVNQNDNVCIDLWEDYLEYSHV